MTIHHKHSLRRIPKSAGKLLSLLAGSKWTELRLEVAEHPHCPVHVLKRLAQDANPEVRMNVANNPNATFEILEILADDESLDVRFYLAEDHRLPKMLLLKLSEDDNPYVASRAKQTFRRVAQEKLVNDTISKSAPGRASLTTIPSQQIVQIVRSLCNSGQWKTIPGTYK